MPGRRKRATPSARVPLSRRWTVALANAGLHQREWAESNRWTESHVSQVVRGKRESRRVLEAVLAFVTQQEQAIAQRAAVPAA